MPEEQLKPKIQGEKPEFYANPSINIFAATNFRNQQRKFGIKLDDRRRHMYIIGKTGMGKTTMMENLVLNDIYAGHGVGLVDPHGDFAEKIINYIPPSRINDVVYFNPADLNYPIGFNILEMVNPDHKHLVASGLMGVFKKIWVDMWSSRMEYILNNTILALLDFPNTTLLGINRLLSDKEYRSRVVKCIKDPVVKSFWETEFASYNDRYAQEAVAPIQNKIGQFLSASVVRNIVAQVKSKIDIRDIMDNKKIFIMNLSKGRIGEDNSALIGGMLITKLQLTAMERVDIPENDRPDFFLYVDEFQNFATPSFANILSEARKYHLGLILAHQYMEQLDETVREAVLGNVGTIVNFRVGSTDAEILAKEFVPIFLEEDLINLPKYNVYLKLMIDGVASKPFSALTLPPIGSPTGSAEKVIKVSRERYAVERDKIEDKIMRWSGMEGGEGEEGEDGALPPQVSPSKTPTAPKENFKPKTENHNNSFKNPIKKFDNKRTDNKNFDRNKSKSAGNVPELSPSHAPKVSLVDTEQKGISLSSLSAKQEKKHEEKTNFIFKPKDNFKPVEKLNIKSTEKTFTLSDLMPPANQKVEEPKVETNLMPGFLDKKPESEQIKNLSNNTKFNPPKVIPKDEIVKVDDDDDAWRRDR